MTFPTDGYTPKTVTLICVTIGDITEIRIAIELNQAIAPNDQLLDDIQDLMHAHAVTTTPGWTIADRREWTGVVST